jgi:hypothetical protein
MYLSLVDGQLGFSPLFECLPNCFPYSYHITHSHQPWFSPWYLGHRMFSRNSLKTRRKWRNGNAAVASVCWLWGSWVKREIDHGSLTGCSHHLREWLDDLEHRVLLWVRLWFWSWMFRFLLWVLGFKLHRWVGMLRSLGMLVLIPPIIGRLEDHMTISLSASASLSSLYPSLSLSLSFSFSLTHTHTHSHTQW